MTSSPARHPSGLLEGRSLILALFPAHPGPLEGGQAGHLAGVWQNSPPRQHMQTSGRGLSW